MTEIVVVDDEPLVLITLRSICDWEKHGMHIAAECGNGKVALEFLRTHPEIDIVLTDVDMPLMDGLSLAESLKSEGHGADVAFLSTYSNFEYVRRAFKSGAADYILKTELDETRIVALLEKMGGSRLDSGKGEEIPAEKMKGADREETGSRTDFLRSLLEDSPADVAGAFSRAAFTVTPPFHFMIIRPGDLPLVRQRYGSALFEFQKTVSDLLSHFIPPGDGDSGALSFDVYWTLMADEEKMSKAFDLFYEAAWSYMDIGFERRIGHIGEDIGDLKRDLPSCLREFVPPSRIVVRTRRYIREHYGNSSLNLAEIALYSEVSKNHLSWEFARETGETIGDFINRTRIQEAKKLLLETNLLNYEIAERTGYANAETFCRVFRKVTGTSPRHYS